MWRRSAPNLRDSAPAGVQSEAKEGTLPDPYRRSFAFTAGALLGSHPWCIQRETTTMPRQKDLKRLVRARTQKTGEAYTAARAQIVRKQRISTPTDAPAAPAVPITITH